MQAITFYLFFPFIYLISLLPFRILYVISDIFFYIVYHIVGYRKSTVIENLTKSFPEKTPIEINRISKDFFRFLCDLIVESVKTISISEKEVRKRTKMHGIDLLNKFYDEQQSVILVMGHYGNWELAGPCFSLNCKHTLNVVYRPLENKYFENVFIKARTKFNTEITPAVSALRTVISNKKRLTATALIADQGPQHTKGAYWMDFLNQDTPVYNGPEKISKMMNYPVIYINITRPKRGYYEIVPTLLFEEAKKTSDDEITISFMQFLEKVIQKEPYLWLWSHKRWKRKRKKE